MSPQSRWLTWSWLALVALSVLAFLFFPRPWTWWVLLALAVLLLAFTIPVVVRWWRRQHRMDRPAIAMSSSIGLVLIAVGILLFAATAPAAGQTYRIAWTQATAADGQKDTPFAGNGQKASTTVTVHDGLFSDVTVTMPACSDVPGPLGQPATISWELFKDNVSMGPDGKGQTPCTGGDVKTLPLHSHADVGTEKAASAGAAQAAAYAGDGAYHNATVHVFRLDFTYTRPASPAPPLPVGGSTLAGRMGIKVQEWKATANLPQEASK